MSAKSAAVRKIEQASRFSCRVLVLINREMTDKVPRVIWAHEKPILEEIFGEGNITDIDVATLDEGYSAKVSPKLMIHNKTQDKILPASETQGIGFLFIGDPAAEYQRLVEAYGKHMTDNMSNVEKVYGRFQSGTFQHLLATPSLHDLPDQQLRSLIRDYGYPGEIGKDASSDEKAEHAKKERELREMDSSALLKLAEELDIET